MADDMTVGRFVTYLESKGGEPVSMGGMSWRWGSTIEVDPDTGEWTEIAVADWAKELRG
jgi:hypothetical protein